MESDKLPYKDGDGYCSFNFINKPAMIIGLPFGVFFGGIFALLIFGFGAFFLFGIISAIVVIALICLSLTIVKLFCENDPNALKFIKYRLLAYFHKLKYTGEFYHSSVNDIGKNKDESESRKNIERIK